MSTSLLESRWSMQHTVQPNTKHYRISLVRQWVDPVSVVVGCRGMTDHPAHRAEAFIRPNAQLKPVSFIGKYLYFRNCPKSQDTTKQICGHKCTKEYDIDDMEIAADCQSFCDNVVIEVPLTSRRPAMSSAKVYKRRSPRSIMTSSSGHRKLVSAHARWKTLTREVGDGEPSCATKIRLRRIGERPTVDGSGRWPVVTAATKADAGWWRRAAQRRQRRLRQHEMTTKDDVSWQVTQPAFQEITDNCGRQLFKHISFPSQCLHHTLSHTRKRDTVIIHTPCHNLTFKKPSQRSTPFILFSLHLHNF